MSVRKVCAHTHPSHSDSLHVFRLIFQQWHQPGGLCKEWFELQTEFHLTSFSQPRLAPKLGFLKRLFAT